MVGAGRQLRSLLGGISLEVKNGRGKGVCVSKSSQGDGALAQ